MTKEKNAGIIEIIDLFQSENDHISDRSLSLKITGNASTIKNIRKGHIPIFDTAEKIVVFCSKNRNISAENTQEIIAETSEKYNVDYKNDQISANIFENLLFFELNRQKIDKKKLVAILMKDNSMSPVIKDKDIVVIDTSNKLLQVGKIVVIKYKNKKFVSRLHLLEKNNCWLGCSDNAKYAPIIINECIFFGTVIWFGRWV